MMQLENIMNFKMIKINKRDKIKEGKKEEGIEQKKLYKMRKLYKRLKKRNMFLAIKYLRIILIGNSIYNNIKNKNSFYYQINYYLIKFCNYKMILKML